MIPSFSSVTSAGPPPHRHKQVFFLSHDGIACFKHHGFGGLFLSPSMWVGYLGNLGTEDPMFSFPKRGGLGLKQRHSKPMRVRGKPEQQKQNMENMEKITLRENWCIFLMMNLQPYSDSIPLICFGIQPFIGKRRSWHQICQLLGYPCTEPRQVKR